jgi:DNA-directed RNA polymerase subunit RPC12/RpoP
MTTSISATLFCPRCERELPVESTQTRGARCYHCESRVEAVVFPAALRTASTLADQAVVSGDATCFFHDDRVAAVSCSNCGRFLCNLCRIEWSGGGLCVACVEALRHPGKSTALESNRFHFDSLALALAIIPSLLIFPSLLTAPAALGLALVTIRRSCSITPRSKWRFVVAMLLSLAVICAWAWLLIYSVSHARARQF